MVEIGTLTDANLKRLSIVIARRVNLLGPHMVWVTRGCDVRCASPGTTDANAIERDAPGYIVGTYGIGAMPSAIADDLTERLLELQPPTELPAGHLSRRVAA